MNLPYAGFPGTPLPIPYEDECKDKHGFLTNLFNQDVLLTPHPLPNNYRIRMDFITTPNALGLRGPNGIQDIEECPILKPNLNECWKQIRTFIKTRSVSLHNPETNEGWLKYVMLRGQEHIQITLTTATPEHEDIVVAMHDTLKPTSLVWTISDRDVSPGTHHKTFGEKTIPITLANKTFSIDPWSFFQASPDAMELAIQRMKEFLPEDASILDLYCGVGTIGIALQPTELVGIESNENATLLAKENAKNNAINATFFSSPAHTARQHADVIIVDPPRTGLQMAVHQITAAKPRFIFYLSCNPKTQRTDIAALRGYETVHIEGFDFFPRTEHVECLVILKRT